MFLGVPPFKETPIFTSYIEHIPRHPTWFVLLVNSFGRDSCSSSHHHGFSWNWQTTEVAFFLQKVSWSNGTSAPNLWFKAFKINATTSKDWWSFHHINRNSAVSISFAYAKLQNFGYIIIFSAFSSTRGISHILWSYSTQASPWGFFVQLPQQGSWKLTEFKSLVNLLALPCSGRCMLKFKAKKSWEVSRIAGRKHHMTKVNTPWKMNGWNLKITQPWKGKSSEPTLHFWVPCLIFRGVRQY